MLQLFTVPLDTAKVRLQLQKKIPTGDGDSLPKYRGFFGTLSIIAREEGISGLWKGVIAGLHRQCIYGGLRIGLYEPVSESHIYFFFSSFVYSLMLCYISGQVKTFLVGSDFIGDIPLYQKILAALLTGAIAIIVANPTDLVKVRLQSEGKLPAGVPRRYAGAVDAYYTIVKLVSKLIIRINKCQYILCYISES